jgi:hypothetical protein
MMAAEALGLTASVISIATLAYDSSKRLYDIITGIQQAPKTLSDLRADLTAVQQLLQSLTSTLEGTNDTALSDGLRTFLQDLNPSIEACKTACDEFAARLTKITSHSREGNLSLIDKVQLQLKEKDITIFKYRLGSHKSTINVALVLANLYVHFSDRGLVY